MPKPLPETHKQTPGAAILIAIGFGALLGTTARFSIGTAIPGVGPSAFPAGTLLINLTGCFLIGVAQKLFRAHGGPRTALLQPGVTVGLLGGFTTFSTFSVETIRLLQTGYVLHALVYQISSVLGGLAAVTLGTAGGQWLSRFSGGMGS